MKSLQFAAQAQIDVAYLYVNANWHMHVEEGLP